MHRFTGLAIAACGPILCMGGVAGAVSGATLRVPSEWGTIQAGLDAAAFGDTVLVAAGTYTDITVRGGRTACAFLKDGVSLVSEDGPQATTIDMMGQGSQQPNVIYSNGFASDATVVEGFTITGPPPGRIAVFVNNSGKHTFRNCVFRDIDARPNGVGAGLGVRLGDVDVFDCHFENCFGAPGGGLFVFEGSTVMRGCTFVNCANTAAVCESMETTSSADISNCVFRENSAGGGGGGGLVILRNYGGASVRDCVFEGNDAGSGGGAAVVSSSPQAVENCVFANNICIGPSSDAGGLLFAGSGVVTGNTFFGHSIGNPFAQSASASIELGTVELRNNVVVKSMGSPAIGIAGTANVSGSCNVFWDNPEGLGDYQMTATDRDVDPQFCDPEVDDFTVADTSPCLPPNSEGCGLIGALGAGCGSVAVEGRSWGAIKGAYR